jgi:hypothetical protein
MAKFVAVIALFALASRVEAQQVTTGSKVSSPYTTPPSSWPVCRLGMAPIDPGPAPKDATVFPVTGGPVVMSEAGPNGSVRWIRCNLAAGTPSYRSADGDLRDVASNQPFSPIGWDAGGIASTNGKDGRGIADAVIEGKNLVLIYTDGTRKNVGRVVGEDGLNGTSVTSIGLGYGDPNCPYGGTKFVSGTNVSYNCNLRANQITEDGKGVLCFRGVKSTLSCAAVLAGIAGAIWLGHELLERHGDKAKPGPPKVTTDSVKVCNDLRICKTSGGGAPGVGNLIPSHEPDFGIDTRRGIDIDIKPLKGGRTGVGLMIPIR